DLAAYAAEHLTLAQSRRYMAPRGRAQRNLWPLWMRLLYEPSTWQSTARASVDGPPEPFDVASPRSRPQAASRLRRKLDRACERTAHGCRGTRGIIEGST